jgi:hypothetical protein
LTEFKPLDLTPWQKEVEKAIHKGAKRILIKAGRKSGKSEYAKFRMVKNALNPPITSAQMNPYITRSRIQAKNIMWDRIKKYVTKDMVEGRFKEVELQFTMKATGIPIKFFGAEDEDNMRGLDFGDYVIDEADFVKRNHRAEHGGDPAYGDIYFNSQRGLVHKDVERSQGWEIRKGRGCFP